MQTCKQHKKVDDGKPSVQCGNPAIFRYTWPGSDESFICDDCVGTLQGVANALGLHLQIIPLFTVDSDKVSST